LISTQALVPYALDKWFGVSGNWALLAGGLLLIFTLIQNPEGIAGDIHKRRQQRLRRRPQPPGAPALRLRRWSRAEADPEGGAG
jgi:branched-chain amino acid transport system permease protein